MVDTRSETRSGARWLAIERSTRDQDNQCRPPSGRHAGRARSVDDKAVNSRGTFSVGHRTVDSRPGTPRRRTSSRHARHRCRPLNVQHAARSAAPTTERSTRDPERDCGLRTVNSRPGTPWVDHRTVTAGAFSVGHQTVNSRRTFSVGRRAVDTRPGTPRRPLSGRLAINTTSVGRRTVRSRLPCRPASGDSRGMLSVGPRTVNTRPGTPRRPLSGRLAINTTNVGRRTVRSRLPCRPASSDSRGDAQRRPTNGQHAAGHTASADERSTREERSVSATERPARGQERRADH
jgi:hypothetical protein